MTSTPTLPEPDQRVEGGVRAQLNAVCDVLMQVVGEVASSPSEELARIMASATAVVAAAEAARAAVALEASSRGVIGTSDHPQTRAWVAQSCREAGVPVVHGQARQLHELTTACAGTDSDGLKAAVTSGRLPLETAAVVAKVYRRLRGSITHPHWDALLEMLIDRALEGASAQELYELEDRLIGQYGDRTELDDKHDREHRNRDFSVFRRDRSGMLAATLRLDPASEVVVTAAIQALSAPRLDADGNPDPRTGGQRRADALVTMATAATGSDHVKPGVAAKARVVVTIALNDLVGKTDAPTPKNADSDGSRHVLGVVAADGVDPNDGRNRLSRVPTLARIDAERAEGRSGQHATTGFGQTLSPSEARMFACDGEIIPAVLGSQSELLDLGRSTRLVTPAQLAALHLRDGGCTYPGCNAPPSWCDGHHIIHWAFGGTTDRTNLTLLCRHHHTVVHRLDHTATIDERGIVTWTRRDGAPVDNAPRWRGGET